MTNLPPPEKTKLLICTWHKFSHWRTPPELAERVRRRWPQMQVIHLPNYDRLDDELPATDIFVGFWLRPEQLARAKRLRWIHATAAGVNQLMYPELRRSGIVVTNARGVHAVPISEHLVGTLVALARSFPTVLRYQLKRQWAQQVIWDSSQRPRELAGQVLLVVGFGAIGRALAERVKPLRMKVWAVTRTGKVDPHLAERAVSPAQLREVLPLADFVVLAAPETPETQHLIGAPELAAMKPSAYLINIARGTLVDEPALIAALARRAIAGAALDVAEQEPLPPESPLWSLENVFITPHISGVSDALWDRQGDLLLENLERWFSGRPLLNRIDLERGY